MTMLAFLSALPRIRQTEQNTSGAPGVYPSAGFPAEYRATGAPQRAQSLLVFLGLTRQVRIPSFHALYCVFVKIFPLNQYERFSLPLLLYLPFCGLKCPRCSNTSTLA